MLKGKLYQVLARISYYPRIIFDSILFCFIKNDYSLLEIFSQKDCLIVGNGPSLNKTLLEKINMPAIGMNKINLIFDKTPWRPDVIVCVNGLVINQNKNFFNTTEIVLVLPIKALYLGIKKRPNIIFLKVLGSSDFISDIKKGVGIGSTVTYTCLQIAGYSNPKKVNIVGVDHSFSLKPEDKDKEHQIERLAGDDVNHFDPDYFRSQLWGLPDLDGSEKAYFRAKIFFDSVGIPIVDYTINGKLRIFPKGNVEDIYSSD